MGSPATRWPGPDLGRRVGLGTGDAAFLQLGSTRALQGKGPAPARGLGRGRTTLQHCNGLWYLPAMRRSPRWNAFPRFAQTKKLSRTSYRVTQSGHTKDMIAAWICTI